MLYQSRKFVTALLIIWLPLFNGSAMASSISMQMMGGQMMGGHCPLAATQPDDSNAHYHDQSSLHQSQSSGQQDQQASFCQDCSVCHFACGGYLATVAIEVAGIRLLAQTYASSSTQFQSFTSAPLDPPPLSRV